MDIWSDIVCPWCAIGRARFEGAMAEFPHRDEVQVRWRSFELNPQAPREYPEPLTQHLATKYGVSLDQAQQMHRNMTEVAADEGLDFHFERARSGNTFDAHRLLHHALHTGGPQLQDRLKQKLFDAYLTNGVPIGDRQALVEVAEQAGLDTEEVRAMLDSDRHGDAVREDETQARRYGITGVPFFVIDDKYGISGAQPAAALRQALDTAWVEAHPQTPLVTSAAPAAGASACTDDGCAI